MIRARLRGRRVFVSVGPGQSIVASGIVEIDRTIEAISSDSELDLHLSLGIIDNLSSARREMIRQREARCLERLLSTH